MGFGALGSIEAITEGLGSVGYISTAQISTAVFLAQHLRKPILIEGPAGVGKTDLAQSTARFVGLPLVRMQCYEGLDESKALYEWKYGKQLLYTQILKEQLHHILEGAETLDQSFAKLHSFEDLFFSEAFLEPRPLLRALKEEKGCILLIDEVDKADEEFEAFLLEVLSEYQVTVPELGPVTAAVPPLVMLTSNNTREIGDALKRRCLHLYISFPEAAREQAIVRARVPGISAELLGQLVAFVQGLRAEELKKLPSIAETVDWARTLLLLHAESLEPELVRATLNVLLKFESDIRTVQAKLETLTRKAREG
ncbi:MAG: MoxR family ATPase [Alphaproteobacteria bacterium]|nr:MoxR family ATPase [Alphaproteobacteria bacterium]